MLRIALVTLAIAVISAQPAAAQDELPPGASVVAGTGGTANDDTRGDGGPATDAGFDRISSIDRMGDGSLLIADSDDGRIRRIAPAGTISTNAGPDQEVQDPVAVVGTTWAPGAPSTPNGFVAADAGRVSQWRQVEQIPGELNSIHLVEELMMDAGASDVDRSADGFWVVQSGTPPTANGQVLLITFNSFLNQWEVEPVLETLVDPRGIGALPGGGFLVTTGFPDCRVLRRQGGVTVPVAGTGECAEDDPQTPGTGPLPGNGGPATSAELRRPHDVVATPDGGFVIAEGALVRRVSPGGVISTVFDTSLWYSLPIPPTPEAIEVLPDGDVLVGIQRRILRFDTNYAAAVQAPAPPPVPSPPLPQPKPFTAALNKAAYKLAKGAKLKLKFTAAGAGTYTVDIRKGAKRVKRLRGKAKAGANVVRSKLKLKTGRYSIKITLTGAAGAKATDTAKLRITRR